MKEANGKNREFVAATEGSIRWGINIKPQATTGSEMAEEIQGLLELLYESFEDFVTPIGVECEIGTIKSDVTMWKALDDFDQIAKPSLRRSEGVDIAEIKHLLGEIDPANNRARYLRRIQFYDTSALLYLVDGEREIRKSNRDVYKFMRGDKIVDATPPSGPISISIDTKRGVEPTEHEDPDVWYSVLFGTRTAIWAGDSKIAVENRRRLSELMNQFREQVDVLDTRFGIEEMYSVTRGDCEELAGLINAEHDPR